MVIDHTAAGPLTGLDSVPSEALATLAADPVLICTPVAELVLHPTDPAASGLPPERLAENQIRPAEELIIRLLSLDPTPLTSRREPPLRVVGTCRHFAVIACALLRYRGIAARVRCGFATYFQPGRAVDHWITEYQDGATGQWIRLDPQVLGQDVIARPDDLTPEQFLTGGEAWLAFRRGTIDPNHFGVYGTENWGPAEISGNAVRDLAALNKIEMLPWDEWGRMTEAYDGRTGDDYDQLLDTVAAVCTADDSSAIAELYAHPDLQVPADLIG